METIQSNSTKQGLSKGPADMPDRGSRGGEVQSNSERVNLTRKETPVAAFGARASQGEVQSNSERVDMARSAGGPYAGKGVNATTPETSFGGKKR